MMNQIPKTLVLIICFTVLYAFSIAAQCNLIIDNLVQPTSCNVSNGSFRAIAQHPVSPGCKRKVHLTQNSVLLATGFDTLNVSGRPSGTYLIIAESGCGCSQNLSQIVTLNGGTPTPLTPYVDLGSGFFQSRNVSICKGTSIKIGVQPLGIANLSLTTPSGLVDNTPDGSSFWNLLTPTSGVYRIKFTNINGCISETTIQLNVSALSVDAGLDQIVCQNRNVQLTALATGAGSCLPSCPATSDSLLVKWSLDQCNAINNTQQNSYSEFVPEIFRRQCSNITATNVFRDAGEHSCTPVKNSYLGDVGLCFMATNSCNAADYDATQALKFEVTLTPQQAGRISKLVFNEQSPLTWVTTNGSTGVNNYNTKYSIRVYKDDLLIYFEDNRLTERTWNEEMIDFSSLPAFNITSTSKFRFEMIGYCVVPNGGDMSGWEVDNIRILGGCCSGLTPNTNLTYLWSNGGTTSSINVTALGTAKYFVTVTDCKGCNAVDSTKITVIPNPTANITGNLSICSGSSTTLTASGGSSYVWSNGASTAAIEVSTAGVYTVTATGANGCQGTASVTVVVNPNPIATITGNLSICSGSSTTLTATGGSTYTWSTSATTAAIEVSTAGTYTVTATDVNGCQGTASVTVVVNPNPVAAITGDLSICAGLSTTLTATGGSTYTWSTSATTAAIEVSTAGTYTVTATDANGCHGTASVTVIVNPNPVATITGNLSICVGSSTTLTASGGSSYVWSTGTTTAGIEVSTAGKYAVTATDANGCHGTASVTVIVIPNPTATITGNLSICSGSSTTLTASGGSSYVWSTGTTTSTIEVSTAGIYAVTATDANGCHGTASVTVVVNPNPVATITGNLSICSGSSTTLTATGGSSYAWSTGTTTSTIEVLTAGIYTVTATDANGCQGTASVTVVVNPNPVATITGNLSICAGSSTTLTATGGSSYAWSNGATTAGIEVSTAGIYTVTATDANGCQGTSSISVIVNPNPVATITGNLSICAGSSTTLTVAGGSSYVWSTGATATSIEVTTAGTYTASTMDANGCVGIASVSVIVSPNPTIAITGDVNICQGETTRLYAGGGETYTWSNGSNVYWTDVTPTTTTTYTVTATDANGCQGTASVTVIVNPNPVATITGNLSICAGLSSTLSATGGSSYAWSNGATTAGIEVSTAGIYTVTATDANGCQDIATATVIVNPNPLAAITGNLSICEGSSTTLSVAGGSSYVWSTGATATSIEVTTAGTYTASTMDANGCVGIASVTVIVSPNPTITITGDVNICQGETTRLYAGGGETYTWSNGSNVYWTDVTPTTTTTYTVTATDANGCQDIATATVIVNPNPVATITGNLSICAGSSTTLTVAGGSSYVWSTGATATSIEVTTAGTYTASTMDANGCVGIASVSVIVSPNPTIAITGDVNICQGETTRLYAGGGETYTWSNGSNVYWTDVTPTTTTTYTVTATDANGCQGTVSVTVIVNPNPVATITGNLSICAGSSTTLTVAGGSSYVWSTGATATSIEVTTAGTYTASTMDANGCVGIASVSVIVSPNPTIAITGDVNICQGETTRLYAGGGETYTWSNGSNVYWTDVTPTTATTYTVTATDANGCQGTSSISVIVNPNPVATITGDLSICAGSSTTLSAAGGSSYVWSTGATATSIEVTTAGTYTASTMDVNGCVGIASVSVIVSPNPTIAITGDVNICQGETTRLYAGGGETYTWSNGSNVYWTDVTPLTTTTYTVTATDANGCEGTSSVTVIVNPNPIATITGNLSICEGSSTTLTATGGSSYVWSNGSTTSTIEVSMAGIYAVTATDANGCLDIAMATVIVNPNPVANITGNLSICEGSSTTLTATGGSSYVWSNGSTTSTIEVSMAGIYAVTATDANGCHGTSSATVIVNPNPVATITGNLSICAGSSTTLTVSGGSSYVWSTGATATSIEVTTAGTYTASTMDVNGCVGIASVSVAVSQIPIATITGINTICQGDTVLITGSGGGDYTWSTGDTTSILTVIITSNTTYTLTVSNSTGCYSTASFSISTKPAPTINISGLLDLCNGQSTLIIADGTSNNACPGECNVTAAVLASWNLNACKSDMLDGSNMIYTEFIAVTNKQSCTNVTAGTAHRLNNEKHSCTPGPNGSIAMCIGAQDVCDPRTLDFSKALRFEVMMTPNQVGQITGLTFWEQSPTTYTWIDGPSGPNNYITKFALRVRKNGHYIYQQYGIESKQTWNQKTFNFDEIDNFKTGTAATYLFELIPYCRIGNGAVESVWDIDEIQVLGGCCSGQASDIVTYQWSTGAINSHINVTPTVNTTYTITATDCCGCRSTKEIDVSISSLDVSLGEDKTIQLGGNILLTPVISELSGCQENQLTYLWSNGATTQTISVTPTSSQTYTVSVMDCQQCVYYDDIRISVVSNKTVVYPNPTKNIIYILTHDNLDTKATIRLYDLGGKLLLNEAQWLSLDSRNTLQVDIPINLNDGLYILEIEKGGLTERHKINVLRSE